MAEFIETLSELSIQNQVYHPLISDKAGIKIRGVSLLLVNDIVFRVKFKVILTKNRKRWVTVPKDGEKKKKTWKICMCVMILARSSSQLGMEYIL